MMKSNQMEIINTRFEGVYLIKAFFHEDMRGSFFKLIDKTIFLEKKLDYTFKECFYSSSRKDVIRGMHFQIPPYEHTKLVYVLSGAIHDVILDIRKNSPTYGEHDSFKIESGNRTLLYVPNGFAHGFKALEDNTTVIYFTNLPHSKEHDAGIRYDSFGFEWNIKNPIISERDQDFTTFKEFKSPFE